MLCLLTSHSLHNRQHHPFLLCKCLRGQGFSDENHECKIISHDNQINHWNRSKKRWERNASKEQVSSKKGSHSKKKHMDWIDENNFGISHFGLHPAFLRRDNMRFDVFHCRCSITRRRMSNLRKFILKQSTEMMKKFSDLLLEFWTDCHVLCWNLEKAFTSFNGKELLIFIQSTQKIVDFLKENFQNTKTLSDLCEGLLLWEKIHLHHSLSQQKFKTCLLVKRS